MAREKSMPANLLTARAPEIGGFYQPVRRYISIMHALVLHDIKNRFFGSGLGMIVMIIWPFVHIMVLIVIGLFQHRPNPYGESVIQYSAVSIFPFICFNYVGRWIVFSAFTNRVFLNYPIIQPLDILVARALLEIVSITIVGILLLVFLIVCGDSIMPTNPTQAAYAVASTIFLAIGFGFINAPFGFILQLWNVVVTLMIIGMYVSSGILFVPSLMPENIQRVLSYNPLLNCIEWLRSAYYSDYPTDVLDKAYVLECGLVMLTLGLIMLKLFRRFL